MENDVMPGEMSGKRMRGRPRTRWLDNMNTIKGPSNNSMRWDARDRGRWRLPRLSPGVGYDSAAQGDNNEITNYHLVQQYVGYCLKS